MVSISISEACDLVPLTRCKHGIGSPYECSLFPLYCPVVLCRSNSYGRTTPPEESTNVLCFIILKLNESVDRFLHRRITQLPMYVCRTNMRTTFAFGFVIFIATRETKSEINGA
jgi:hypothetical protein